MALASFEVFGVLNGNADRPSDCASMDQWEPAERNDAEQELRGFSGWGVVQTQLGTDGRKGFLPGGEMAHAIGKSAAVQRFSLDQPDEVRPHRQKVEVVRYRARQDRLRVLRAGQSSRPAGPDGITHLGETAVQDSLVKVRLGAEEVAGGGAGDSGRRSNFAEAGGFVPFFGKQLFGRVQNSGPASGGIALFLYEIGQMPSMLACCSAS